MHLHRYIYSHIHLLFIYITYIFKHNIIIHTLYTTYLYIYISYGSIYDYHINHDGFYEFQILSQQFPYVQNIHANISDLTNKTKLIYIYRNICMNKYIYSFNWICLIYFLNSSLNVQIHGETLHGACPGNMAIHWFLCGPMSWNDLIHGWPQTQQAWNGLNLVFSKQIQEWQPGLLQAKLQWLAGGST